MRVSMALVVWKPAKSRCPASNIYCEYPGERCAICGVHQCADWEGSVRDPTTGKTYCAFDHQQPTSRGD
jgi:hypothetical protein